MLLISFPLQGNSDEIVNADIASVQRRLLCVYSFLYKTQTFIALIALICSLHFPHPYLR